jgi:predicted MFS family arabinose efflux permease/quinol monooxygenase YgiN
MSAPHAKDPPTASPPVVAASAWAPFRSRTFAVIWTATVVSNIGGWMYTVASGWLMTSLNPDPFIVSLVQVANSLPMFLFAIPAGALVDIVDRRRFLISGESAITITSAAFAALVWLHLITPTSLLLFSFIVTVGSAITAPAWQAVVAQLVPKSDLSSAVAGNSVGINVSRTVGPALGGVIVGAFGIAAPFWLNAFSNIGVIAALVWWRPPKKNGDQLPPEPFGSAVRIGLRHARYNAHLSATLLRAIGFFVFASAYWALLPLIARSQIAGGPALYGMLLGAIGASAVGGAFALPWLKARLDPDRLLAAATVATSVATGLFALAHDAVTAVVASLIAGASWIAALSTLNLSAQVALPEWVRGRGLAMYVTVMFGALTLGSAIWGEVAAKAGLPAALFLAAAGAIVAIPLSWRWKLQTGANVDFSPSMHWAAPVTTRAVEKDRGPVLVMVEYRIDPKNREAFLEALGRYAQERRRDGAYDWKLFEDPAEEGRFIETFMTDSWLEHLRQHQRVTKADRILEQEVRRFQIGSGPKTTHLVGAQTRD